MNGEHGGYLDPDGGSRDCNHNTSPKSYGGRNLRGCTVLYALRRAFSQVALPRLIRRYRYVLYKPIYN